MKARTIHKKLIEFYDTDDSYFEKLDNLGTMRYRFIEALIRDKQSRILDIGCGTGNLLRYLKSLGYCNLEGIDACQRFARHAMTNGIRIHNIDVLDYESSTKYDCIIAFDFLEHAIDIPGILGKIDALLSKNGILIICGPNMIPVISSNGKPTNFLALMNRLYLTKIRKKYNLHYFEPVLDSTTYKMTDLDAINDINPLDLKLLLGRAGFKVYMNTFFNPIQKYTWKKPIVKALSTVPVIRYMGGTILAVCRKNFDSVEMDRVKNSVNKEL